MWAATAVSEPPDDQALMHAKLRHAQSALRSVALGDFAQLEKDADALAELSRNAAWQVDRSEEYRRESVEFERTTYALGQAAEHRRLDGATLAFLNVAISCVDCHAYLRDQGKLGDTGFELAELAPAEPGPPNLNLWMERKLKLAQSSLAAISIADFATLKANSRELRILSSIEGWTRRTNVREYRAHLQDFERANVELSRAADEENIDKAVLAFSNMTLSCVDCHEKLGAQANK
jgi:cytochrome c556